MPFVAKPVAFDSINFLPGFPGNSRYSCNPWSIEFKAGACAVGPTAVGREPAGVMDARAMALAILAASNSHGPVRLSGLGGASEVRVHSREITGRTRLGSLAGDCGCGGRCGCGEEVPRWAGMGDLSVASVTDWAKANWVPLLVGGGLVWFLKRRR